MMARNLSACSGVRERAGAQRLGVAADGGQRRAQLVRDIGDEVAPGRLQFLQCGDVMKHEDEQRRLAVERAHRRCRHLEVLGARGARQRDLTAETPAGPSPRDLT